MDAKPFIHVRLYSLTHQNCTKSERGRLSLSLRLGYLTARQRLIWRLKSDGFTEASIGRKLDITRQTVHNAFKMANMKLLQALEETAKINKTEIKTISTTHGYLIGYSPYFNTRAFVTYSTKNGIQICYPNQGNCKKCKRAKECREIFLKEARDREIEFDEGTSQMPPTKIAQALFSIIEGANWNE